MAFSHQPAQAHQGSLGTTRLPSIRDLNFAYDPPPQLPPDSASSPSGPIQQSDHRTGPAPSQPQRHDWSRPAPPPPSQPSSIHMHRSSQHSPVVVNTHDHPRHEPPFGQAGGLSSQMPPPPPRDSESMQKRPRNNATPMGVSPRSSHVSAVPCCPIFLLLPSPR